MTAKGHHVSRVSDPRPVAWRGYNPQAAVREVSGMSDKEMEKLPERSVSGVNRKTQVRTLVSGLLADARRLVQQIRGRRRKP